MIYFLLAGLIGAIIGAVAIYVWLMLKIQKITTQLKQSQSQAEDQHKKTREQMEIAQQKNLQTLENERVKLEERESRIADKDRYLQEERTKINMDRKKAEEIEQKLEQKEIKIEKKVEELENKKEELEKKHELLETEVLKTTKLQEELQGKLYQVAALSPEEAKVLVVAEIEQRYEADLLSLIEKKRADIKLREKDIAKEILIKSLQQYAADVTTEVTQTTIKIENDDLKGKIIGKEGRNIIAFEKATGVNIIIDDTPETVFISSFDLLRRYIAKKSLEQLLEDKRIQPARIEEIVEKNQKDAEQVLFELGEKTLLEMGISGMPAEIISLIGKLRFRTSYGQNLLTHSKEVAYISEGIAKLIGADPVVALKGGLLHDIGKALDHDIEWTHPEIGGKIARKYHLPESIINIIEAHHDDTKQTCIETKIIQIADTISAVRPGARRVSVEQYIKRIQEMEAIALSHAGVSKAYALSAGREVRVFVDAYSVSDIAAEKLAANIAMDIEKNLQYPGEIKVNLIRERRIVEYAK